MDLYSFLRQLADSWALLALVGVFIGVILFVWRPGSRRIHRDAAESIFRNERRPESRPDPNPDPKEGDE